MGLFFFQIPLRTREERTLRKVRQSWKGAGKHYLMHKDVRQKRDFVGELSISAAVPVRDESCS